MLTWNTQKAVQQAQEKLANFQARPILMNDSVVSDAVNSGVSACRDADRLISDLDETVRRLRNHADDLSNQAAEHRQNAEQAEAKVRELQEQCQAQETVIGQYQTENQNLRESFAEQRRRAERAEEEAAEQRRRAERAEHEAKHANQGVNTFEGRDITDALRAVVLERKRQPPTGHDNRNTGSIWGSILADYLGRFTYSILSGSPQNARKHLVRLAATALAAIEAMDRNGGELK